MAVWSSVHMPYPLGIWNPEPPIPVMDHTAGWKDSAFSWAMGRVILWRIAQGWTMKQITRDPKMPAYCTVFQWMKVVPEFGEAVAEARGKLVAARLAARDEARRARGPKRRSGRKPQVSAEALDALLTRVREGAAVSEAVAVPGAPSAKAVYTRVRGCPGFRAAFVDACNWRADMLGFEAEAAVDSFRTVGYRAARARYEALVARKGRLRPKLYRKIG